MRLYNVKNIRFFYTSGVPTDVARSRREVEQAFLALEETSWFVHESLEIKLKI